MLGRDTLSRMNKWFTFMSRPWKKHSDFVFGVFCRKDAIYLIQLKKGRNSWIENETVRLSFLPETESDIEHRELQAERISTELKIRGWKPEPVALCITLDEAFTATTQIPNIPTEEMTAAIHWELASLHNFEGKEFRSAHLQYPNSEGQWSAAIPKDVSDSWKAAFKNNDLELAALTVMPPFLRSCCSTKEMELIIKDTVIATNHDPDHAFYETGGWEALYAAETLCFPQVFTADFLSEERASSSGWNWKSLSITAVSIAFVIIFSCFLWDQYQLFAARKALNLQENQLALLQPRQTEKKLLEEALSRIAVKQKHLIRLTGESFPWRSILIHLGTMTTDGVWLTDITRVSRDTLEIKGKALHYESLAEFLQKFETDRTFFPQPPLLQSSKAERGSDNQITICFSLQMNLVSGVDHHGTTGS